MVRARFMSVKGPFKTVKEETFPAERDAFLAVQEFYAALGFTNIAIKVDDEFDGARVTAKTPGGRGGRNIAFLDEMGGDYS